jgi:hypothetical protein
VVGGVAGGISGLLGVDEAARFHDYVMLEHRFSYRYSEEPQVRMILPPEGFRYYPVPPEFRVAPGYRYVIMNDHAVLVDPCTRQIVQIID